MIILKIFLYSLTRMDYLGILKKFRYDTWGKAAESIPRAKFHEVNGEQVSRIYCLLLIGHMLSVFAVTFEILSKKNYKLNAVKEKFKLRSQSSTKNLFPENFFTM